jgi:LysR family transcriptional activator of nhaA
MDWLNYHHLYYFWIVAREGGVTRAAAKLRLAQPTISAQIKLLETALGERLFTREGRTLVLTDVGRLVYRYAEDIFPLGRELVQVLRGRRETPAARVTVGVANPVPKLVVFRLLQPALARAATVQLTCREDNADRLVQQLAAHELDVVISDRPAAPDGRVRVFSHLLGESDIAFFAPPALAVRIRRRFPASLAGCPLLLPTRNTALRPALDDWLDRHGLHPRLLAEFEDSALMKMFGREVGAVFPAPAAIARDVCRVYGVAQVGRIAEVRETYFAISAERRVRHPGVAAITDAARGQVFA